VDIGSNPQHELATRRLVGCAAKTFARSNVVINGHVKVGLKLGDRLAMKRDDIVNV